MSQFGPSAGPRAGPLASHRAGPTAHWPDLGGERPIAAPRELACPVMLI